MYEYIQLLLSIGMCIFASNLVGKVNNCVFKILMWGVGGRDFFAFAIYQFRWWFIFLNKNSLMPLFVYSVKCRFSNL